MTTISGAAEKAPAAEPLVGRPDVNRKRMARLGWTFTAPSLIVIGLVTIFPIVYSVVLSLSNATVSGNGVALNGFTGSNYSLVLGSSKWHYALGFTIIYTLITVVIELALGTLIALVLERLTAGRGLMMALLLIPWSMITVINAELWGYIYQGTYGVADAILNAIGLGHPNILGQPTPAIIGLMIADIWKTTPFVAILVLAGLVMLPGDIYEAAEVDGSSGWSTFWRITVPLLRPTLALAVMFRGLPLYWLIASSFKTPANLGNSTPQYFPNPLSVGNYTDAFKNNNFGQYFINSLIVTLVATALVLFFGTMAGYALGRLPMRGKFTLMVTLLIISVFPAIAVIAPLYLVLRNLGWLNSYQGLIIPYTAFNLPFAIWILRNYMLGIPKEMEETGRIDGAGPIRTLWTIILPMALPGIFTAGIFCFTACWTEFLMALTFNSANQYRTIPVGIAEFGTVFTVPYGTIFAASVVAVVPIGILVFIFRRFVISGLTSGA